MCQPVPKRFWSVTAFSDRESQVENHSRHCGKQKAKIRSWHSWFVSDQHTFGCSAFNTEHSLNASSSLGQRESWAIPDLQLSGLKNWSEYQFILLDAGFKNFPEFMKLKTDIWVTWHYYSSIIIWAWVFSVYLSLKLSNVKVNS